MNKDLHDEMQRQVKAVTPSAAASDKSDHPAGLQSADPILGDCPVRAVGHRGLEFYYLNPAGELVPMAASAHRRANIEGLFLGDTAWLTDNFAAHDKEGNRTGSWTESPARNRLMQACQYQGLFDPNAPRRGIGVWLADGIGIIVHAGDRLLVPAAAGWTEYPAGQRIQQILYLAAPPVERPAVQPAAAAEGTILLRALGHWRWQHEASPLLVAGWIAQAMLGATIEWRAHCLIVGPHGSGKSWLIAFIRAAMGGAARDALNSVTEAGLRQILANESRSVLVDEQEASTSQALRVEQVVELVRLMSSGDGASTVRGTPEGQARSGHAMAAVLMAAINPPALKPQDRSRITVVQLTALPTGRDAIGTEREVYDLKRKLAQLSPRLRSRMIRSHDRLLGAVDLYRSALLLQECQPRVADQYATLLAGAFALTTDGLPDAERIDRDIAQCGSVLAQAREVDGEEGEGHACLTHLLTSLAESASHSGALTVGELAALARANSDKNFVDRLARVGCRLSFDAGGNPWFVVANQHAGLDRIYRDTRWAQGRWRTALRQLPGVAATAEMPALSFAGQRQRGSWVPAKYLPARDGADSDADAVDGSEVI